MDPLLEQFLSEARENLAFIDQNIEEIGGDDPELLNSVFRAAHTLKGGSGIVGFEAVKNITHHAEDLLDMLRSGKLEFADGMTDALYDAFDEVMNLVEAAEESGEIVDADEETVEKIVQELSKQMGKELAGEESWELPFVLVDDVEPIINIPMKTLRGVEKFKIPFTNPPLDEEFCKTENFYAVVFDVDDSCMVYGNDPIYTLSLLGDKVLGVFSCMGDENAKSVLSGTEDEDGLLLRTYIVAFIYATYEEMEDSLFNFIDELQLLPLDVQSLLSVDVGDSGHQIDSLKELMSIADDFDLDTIAQEVEDSMKLVGSDTIQYAQLERFLDIVGLIDDKDTSKLNNFFANIYKGEVYKLDDAIVPQSTSQEEINNDLVEDLADTQEAGSSEELNESAIEINENTQEIVQEILSQQYKALSYVANDDDLLRVKTILSKTAPYVESMPESFSTKEEMVAFLQAHLHEAPLEVETPKSETQVQEKVAEKPSIAAEEKPKVTQAKSIRKKAGLKRKRKKQ